MRWLVASNQTRDRGAIALIVSILFMFGVILGCAALTIDVGSINAERRTLQNGADAAAMLVARTCAATKTCPTFDNSALVALVNSNDTKDQYTKIARVDGKAAVCGVITTDLDLPACEALQPGLSDCPTPQTSPAQYIRVYTQTQNSADSADTILPPIFGQTVVAGYKGVTQQTCASVGIGSLGSSPDALPIVIAQCAYDTMLAANTPSFPPMPPPQTASQTTPVPIPIGPPTDYSAYAMTIWSHIQGSSTGPAKCNATNSGLFLPGGFGWTDSVDDTHCSANFTFDKGVWTMPVGNGAAIPSGCKHGGTSPKRFVGTTTYIPIMTGVSGGKYVIDGLAGFYVAGYNAPAASPKNWDGYTDNGSKKIPKLSGGNDGIWGWFTNDFVSMGSFGTTTVPRGPTFLGNIG